MAAAGGLGADQFNQPYVIERLDWSDHLALAATSKYIVGSRVSRPGTITSVMHFRNIET